MKKKVGKKVLSLVLAAMMVVTTMFAGSADNYSAEVEKAVVWQDAGMEDFWNGGVWSNNITDWDNQNLTVYDYAANSLSTDAIAAAGLTPTATGMNFYSTTAGTIVLSQTVASLPAGTYTLTAPVMGRNAQVSFAIGDETGTTNQWLTDWGTWDIITDTFTTTEDKTDVTISVSFACGDGGWGYIDSLLLTSTDVTILDTAPVYDVTITPNADSVEKGGTISLEATVTKDGVEVTDLTAAGIDLWWWLTDTATAELSNYDDNSGKSLTADVTLNETGDHTINVTVETPTGNVMKSYDLTATAPTVGYAISVAADTKEVEVGGTVNLTATVLKDGEAVDDLEAEGLEVSWAHNTEKGNQDAEYDAESDALTNAAKLISAGDYYFTVSLKDKESGDVLETASITLTAKEVEEEETENTEDTEDIEDTDEKEELDDKETTEETGDVYKVEITADETSVANGDTVKLSAKVTLNDEEITDLEAAGLQLWWWTDVWAEGHTDGLNDAKYSNYDDNSGHSLTADVTTASEGNYYIVAELKQGNTWLAQDDVTIASKAADGTENKPEINTNEVINTTADATNTTGTTIVVALQNADFTAPLDGTWIGEVTGGWVEGNAMDVLAYSTDAWLELPSNVGTTGLKFNMNQNATMTISQWVETLPAGTYTVTAPVMGENTDVYLVVGDQEVKATSLSGYNSWQTATATFTIAEDMTNVKIGFKLVATSSGDNYSWGWIDSISMVGGTVAAAAAPKTGDNNMVGLYAVMFIMGCAVIGYTTKRKAIR